MAPNAMTYDSIQRPADFADAKARRSEVSTKLAVAVAVCACMLFFAGRSQSPSEFNHQEVLDIQAFCGHGEFIGGCNSCKECGDFEYANGGCSFFKDTFCTYCETIDNCPRELTFCTSNENSQCQLCDCHDPVKEWTDVEISHYTDYHAVKAGQNIQGETYSCYIAAGNEDADAKGTCAPCTVCDRGFYEVAACDPETNTDTVCKACTVCDEHEWTARVCEYASDTVCQACDYCADESGEHKGEWTKSACHLGTIHHAGSNAVCATCTMCEDGEYVSDFCVAGLKVNGAAGMGADTQCAKCSICEGTTEETNDSSLWIEHIAGEDGTCKKGERYVGDGCTDDSKEGFVCVNHDTVCQDCLLPGDETTGMGGGYWFSTPCLADSTDAPVLNECDQCGDYTFMIRECSPFQASICKACAENKAVDPFTGKTVTGELDHCDFENHRCRGRNLDSDDENTKAGLFRFPSGLHWAFKAAGVAWDEDCKRRALTPAECVEDCEDSQIPLKGHALGEGCDLSYFEDAQGCGRVASFHADGVTRCTDEQGFFDTLDSGSDSYDSTLPKFFKSEHVALSWCERMYDSDGSGKADKKDTFSACQDGFLGMECNYLKLPHQCGKDYLKEIPAKKGRKWFDGGDDDGGDASQLDMGIEFPGMNSRSPALWVAFCSRECEENPFCTAFEVHDPSMTYGISSMFAVTKKSTCRLYKKPLFCREPAEVGMGEGSLYIDNRENMDWFSPTFSDEGGEAVQGVYFTLPSSPKYGLPNILYGQRNWNFGKPLVSPNYSLDCYVNVNRDPKVLDRANACPGHEVTSQGPALCYTEDGDCRTDAERKAGCDDTNGMSYCAASDSCIDRSTTPCFTKPKKQLQHFCADGLTYCYCTGKCMDKAGGDKCSDPNFIVRDADSYNLNGFIKASCWAAENLEVEVSELLEVDDEKRV